MRSMLLLCPLALTLLACGGEGGAVPDSGSGNPSDDAGALGDASASPFTDASTDGGATACDPPDMLIVLDRSDSMSASPGKADGGTLPSKWTLAEQAVDAITAAPSDTKLRFGLEVFPKVAGACGTGDMLVPMGKSSGATIASTLATTKLLYGTPIGGALTVAQSTLQAAKVQGRNQYAILVTDGGETCSSSGSLPVVQALAADDVKTYIVGFGGAVDKSLLNDLACAGMTADKFSTSCKKTKAGYVSNGGTSALYFSAQDGTSLQSALSTITGAVGCTVN